MLLTADFETFAIEPRPHYPPEPVGVALQEDHAEPTYLAWGHPCENNTDRDKARARLLRYWEDPAVKILFHNAKFDLAVAEEKLDLPQLPWHRVHDTMFQIFLVNPHAKSLALKASAVHYLNLPPDEQTELHGWIHERRADMPTEPVRYTRSRAGAFIAYAPGDLVGKYARGDVVRTRGLFDALSGLIEKHDMGAAYDRERRLLPILMENERVGLRVDQDRLERDVPMYERELARADDWLRERLGDKSLELDNDRNYASALSDAGVVDDDKWKLTKSGQRSVSKTALPRAAYNDPEVHSVYGYRGKLATALRMFLSTWRDTAAESGGTIHPQWNQVRGERGGTRTGRPSMTEPNLLNVAKEFEEQEEVWVFPSAVELSALPLVREYVLPDEGHIWNHRDYDGQELRVYSHFERGAFWQMYQDNPYAKPHDKIRAALKELLGYDIGKTKTKNVNFGRIYGGGVPRISDFTNGDMSAAREICSAHKQAMPDLAVINSVLESIARAGNPIRTWGGRLYFVEPAKVVDGKWREFYYKLLNYLVQGSSADITKEAIIRWHDHTDRDKDARLLLTVYDEINISAPAEVAIQQMRVQAEAMLSIELSIPLLSNPKMGRAWGLATGQHEQTAADGAKHIEPEEQYFTRMTKELGLG